MVNNTNGVALCYPFRRAPEIDIGVGVGIGVERRGNKKTILTPTATPKMLRLYSQRLSAAGNNSLPHLEFSISNRQGMLMLLNHV